MNSDLPDCPHPGCDAAQTLEVIWTEMGARHCVCTCCGKPCRVDYRGGVHRDERTRRDVSGNPIEGYDY